MITDTLDIDCADKHEAMRMSGEYLYNSSHRECVQPQSVNITVYSKEELDGEEDGCKLCNSREITINVETKEPDDAYYFSTSPTVNLMYCPLCGKYINRYR